MTELFAHDYGVITFPDDPNIIPLEDYNTNVTINAEKKKNLTLENIFTLIHDQGSVLALVKPQFEAGKKRIGKKGVIKNPSVRLDVLFELYDWCDEKGMILDSAMASPIQGKLGNQEDFFHLFKKTGERRQMKRSALLSIVGKEEKN